MNIFRPAFYQLYLLQLENYDLSRYWKVFLSKVKTSPTDFTQRQHIVWTNKAFAIISISLLLSLTSAFTFAYNFSGFWSGVALFISFFVYFNILAPIFLSLGVIILWPLDFAAKRIIIGRAKEKVSRFKKLKVIGITGSFGKTTMRECLATVLSEKYKVLRPGDSINTPLGIARLILNKLDDSYDIFIVEMGAYHRGDIAQLCDLTPPDISVLTGINEAHLERFGSIGNTVLAKFEIVKYAKPDALIVLSEDNELIRKNYQNFIGSRKVLWYSNTRPELAGITTPVLGSYILGVVSACVIIAKELGLSEEEFRSGISKIKPIPHRLQLIPSSNGVTVIDDSYNGNPDGVSEAIKVLSSFKDKRKIYITPGLVEMSDKTAEIHREIGKKLSPVADMVILIKNSVTPYIAEGLKSSGYDQGRIVWFASSLAAHAGLQELLKPGDVILFQNDWPDNYL